MAEGNGRALGKRALKLGGWRSEKQVAAGEAERGLREGRAAVDGGRQWQGSRERPNAKLGGWRNERRVAAVEAAAPGAAGRPSC